MSDPISPYRAGGWPNEHNPWGRWENNGTGKLFETAADGSWLDNGDYERAYKGFPSYKQVNLFVGGGTYFAPSWKTTLGFGLGRLATTGLGLWVLSLFGRKKQQPAQASFTVNPYLTYFNNLKSRFMPTGLGINGITGTIGGTGGTQTIIHKCECDCCNDKKPDDTENTQGVRGEQGVEEGGNKGQAFEATATNIKSTYNVSGSVKNEGNLNADGFPESFEIHDSNITKDKDHPNIYKYVYVRTDEATGKPVYKFDSVSLQTDKKKEDLPPIIKNEFLVKDGIVKDKGITGNITDMAAINPTGPGVSKGVLVVYKEGMTSVTLP